MQPILSRPIRIAGVTARTRFVVSASEEERAALAAANGLEGVTSLDAAFDLAREGRSGLRARGKLAADVVYRCIVTLEPVPGRIEEEVDVLFSEDPPPETDGEVSLEAEDPPEPAPGGVADLGAIAAEFFALALDPYPRAPGAALAPVAEPEEPGPFAALARLKDRPEGG